VLVGGGSAANLTALACAREALAGPMSDDLIAYCSHQAHSSIARAARVLGFRPDQVRVLPTDDRFRKRPDALAATMAADVAAGRRPLFVAAAAGSTNTGAVDPFAEIAAIAGEHGAWLHIDGAYGGFAALTERGSAALAGIELADSVTLDPHKWLYRRYACACSITRRRPPTWSGCSPGSNLRRSRLRPRSTPSSTASATVIQSPPRSASNGTMSMRRRFGRCRSSQRWMTGSSTVSRAPRA